MQTDLYWGAEWDQQQAYVDVQGIYLGLRDGQMSKAEAQSALETIRSNELVPWIQEDLSTLESAWRQAADLLGTTAP